MKITKERLKQIILQEHQRLQEDISKDEESKVAHLVYILLGKARENFEEHLGKLPDEEEPSEEFKLLYDAISDAWKVADKILTGGETRDALPDLFEDNSDCTPEEISNALEVVSRCVMKGQSQRPKSTEVELGVMPSRIGAPPPGSEFGGIKWIDEDKEK